MREIVLDKMKFFGVELQNSTEDLLDFIKKDLKGGFELKVPMFFDKRIGPERRW